MADVIWQTAEYRKLIQRRVASTNFYTPKVGVIDMYGNSPDSSLLFRGNGLDKTLIFGGQTLTAVFDEAFQTVFDVRFVTTIGGTEYTITGSSANAINYESMSVAGSTFSFGDFIGKIADMTFFDIAGDYDDVSFEGAYGVLSYGVQRTSGSYYWVSCGSFLVDDSKRTGTTVWLSLTDYRSKFDGIHTGSIAANRTIFGIAQDVCTSARVTLGSVVGDLPNGATVVTNSATLLTSAPITTDIQLITYIAQATGTFAIIGRDDKLYFRWYANVSPVYSIDRRYISSGQTVADYTVSVTGISWTDVNGTKYANGTSTYQLDVSNNPFVVGSYATLLTNIATNVVGFSYNPIELKWVGDPALDVGDIIVVPDKKGNVFSVPITSISCKNLMSQTMKSVGESHLTNSSVKVSTTTQIETAKNEAIAFARFQEIVADRITSGTFDGSLMTVINLIAQTLTNSPTADFYATTGDVTIDGTVYSGIFGYLKSYSSTVPMFKIIAAHIPGAVTNDYCRIQFLGGAEILSTISSGGHKMLYAGTEKYGSATTKCSVYLDKANDGTGSSMIKDAQGGGIQTYNGIPSIYKNGSVVQTW